MVPICSHEITDILNKAIMKTQKILHNNDLEIINMPTDGDRIRRAYINSIRSKNISLPLLNE